MSKRHPAGYWNKQRCLDEATKYRTLSAFCRGSGSAYFASSKNGWLADVRKMLRPVYQDSGHWTKQRCMEVSRKCSTVKEFRLTQGSAYNACRSGGWLEEATSHMHKACASNGYWSEDRILAEITKYDSISDFRKGCPSGYSRAVRTGLADKLRAELKSDKLPNGHFTKERCADIAKEFRTRGDFFDKQISAYSAARRNGWLNEICAHMIKAKRSSDMNAIYVITSDGILPSEFHVKFGVTSVRRGKSRIKECSRLIADPVLRLFEPTSRAKEIEQSLLNKFTSKPTFIDKSVIGHSEVRVLSQDEYVVAIETIQSMLIEQDVIH